MKHLNVLGVLSTRDLSVYFYPSFQAKFTMEKVVEVLFYELKCRQIALIGYYKTVATDASSYKSLGLQTPEPAVAYPVFETEEGFYAFSAGDRKLIQLQFSENEVRNCIWELEKVDYQAFYFLK